MAGRPEACIDHDAFRFSVAVGLAAEKGEAFAIMGLSRLFVLSAALSSRLSHLAAFG